MRTSTADYDSLSVYLKNISKYPTLTAVELRDLYEKMATDPKARERIIQCNLKLVVWVAEKYTGCGLSMQDVIAEGNKGLMVAVDKYDPNRAAFSTYANIWIVQHIRRAINNTSREIREPEHVYWMRHKITKFVESYVRTHGSEPNDQDVASGIKANIALVKKIRKAGSPITFRSLDESVGEGDEENLYNIIPTDNPTPSESAETESLNNVIENLIDEVLTKREAVIMRQRFGIGGVEPRALNKIDIGEGEKVTSERVRQMQVRGLEKLRKRLTMPGYENILQDFKIGYGVQRTA